MGIRTRGDRILVDNFQMPMLFPFRKLHNKLLQQIWRLALSAVECNGILISRFISLGSNCSAAKQLNRTLYAQNSLTHV
jgi:hypothetical protein